MSSTAFLSYLKPDPRLRIAAIVCGQLTAAVAIFVILTMTLPVAVRAVGCIACALYAAYELRGLQRGFRHCLGIRVAPGPEFWLRDAELQWHPATLQNGSIVLLRCGWLRLKGADGRQYCEPLLGDAGSDPDWRRLRVIWRHIGAA